MIGISKKDKEQINEFTKIYGEILHGMHRDLTEYKSFLTKRDDTLKETYEDIKNKHSVIENHKESIDKIYDEIKSKEKNIETHYNTTKAIKESLEASLTNFYKEHAQILSEIEGVRKYQEKTNAAINKITWFVIIAFVFSLISIMLYLL